MLKSQNTCPTPLKHWEVDDQPGNLARNAVDPRLGQCGAMKFPVGQRCTRFLLADRNNVTEDFGALDHVQDLPVAPSRVEFRHVPTTRVVEHLSESMGASFSTTSLFDDRLCNVVYPAVNRILFAGRGGLCCCDICPSNLGSWDGRHQLTVPCQSLPLESRVSFLPCGKSKWMFG